MKIYNYESEEHYKQEQEKANFQKLKNIWVQEKTVKKIFYDFGENCSAIICHGTRNAAEQNFFKKYYPNAEILGSEISSTASQFAMTAQWDFRKQNKDWLQRFDILYSNSFDHTNAPKETLLVWQEQITDSGCMYIEFSFDPNNNSSRASDPFEIDESELIDLFQYAGLKISNIYNTQGPSSNDASKLYALTKNNL